MAKRKYYLKREPTDEDRARNAKLKRESRAALTPEKRAEIREKDALRKRKLRRPLKKRSTKKAKNQMKETKETKETQQTKTQTAIVEMQVEPKKKIEILSKVKPDKKKSKAKASPSKRVSFKSDEQSVSSRRSSSRVTGNK